MPNKSLGQHWLKDPAILSGIADSVNLTAEDTVLEIGPGLGTLTSALLRRAGRVIAVEYDSELAGKLPGQFPGTALEVIHEDILLFDFTRLPQDYSVVANVPYYITAKILTRLLGQDGHKPQNIVVLVQQEVAEKYAAAPGSMSKPAVLLQNYYDVQLGIRVPKMYFTPPPLVDSQVLICKKRDVLKIAENSQTAFQRIVQAGFSAPRKKLRSSLAAGLHMQPADVDAWLQKSQVNSQLRAQDLSLEQWQSLV